MLRVGERSEYGRVANGRRLLERYRELPKTSRRGRIARFKSLPRPSWWLKVWSSIENERLETALPPTRANKERPPTSKSELAILDEGFSSVFSFIEWCVLERLTLDNAVVGSSE